MFNGRLSPTAKLIIRNNADLPERPNLTALRWDAIIYQISTQLLPDEADHTIRVLARWERIKWAQAFQERARQQESQAMLARDNAWRAEAV